MPLQPSFQEDYALLVLVVCVVGMTFRSWRASAVAVFACLAFYVWAEVSEGRFSWVHAQSAALFFTLLSALFTVVGYVGARARETRAPR